MRKSTYWVAATALVVALLFLIFAVALLIGESSLSFHRVWASALVLLGLALIGASRLRAALFLRQFGRTGESRRNTSRHARGFFALYGVALAAGGLGYG